MNTSRCLSSKTFYKKFTLFILYTTVYILGLVGVKQIAVVTAQEYLENKPEKGNTLEARLTKNVFIRRCKNQAESLNMIQNELKNYFINFKGCLIGLRRKKIIFEGLWHVHCPGGKRPLRPKKQSKILQIIIAKVHKICLPGSLTYAFTLQKQSCKARFKNDKDLG